MTKLKILYRVWENPALVLDLNAYSTIIESLAKNLLIKTNQFGAEKVSSFISLGHKIKKKDKMIRERGSAEDKMKRKKVERALGRKN